jgi:perosamine synthetase
MTTGGEGGMVTTSNSQFADYIRCFRNHGMTGRDDHVLLGGNYRMTEMEAAIGLVQLGKLETFNENRISRSQRLFEKLHDVPWLQVPQVPQYVRHTYFWFHILIDEERLGFPTSELIERLAERGIETRRRYQAPLYRQPLLTENLPALLRHSVPADRLNYAEVYLKNAEKVAGSIIGLPNRPDMTDDEIDYVCRVVRSVV